MFIISCEIHLPQRKLDKKHILLDRLTTIYNLFISKILYHSLYHWAALEFLHTPKKKIKNKKNDSDHSIVIHHSSEDWHTFGFDFT